MLIAFQKLSATTDLYLLNWGGEAVLVIEPRVLYMLSKYYTTELLPQSNFIFFDQNILMPAFILTP
jgi:hypothetical protein